MSASLVAHSMQSASDLNQGHHWAPPRDHSSGSDPHLVPPRSQELRAMANHNRSDRDRSCFGVVVKAIRHQPGTASLLPSSRATTCSTFTKSQADVSPRLGVVPLRSRVTSPRLTRRQARSKDAPLDTRPRSRIKGSVASCGCLLFRVTVARLPTGPLFARVSVDPTR